MEDNRSGDERDRRRGSIGALRRILRRRFWIYGVIVLTLFTLRVFPELKGQLEKVLSEKPRDNLLILSGLDLAPTLIPRLADAYQGLYPDHEIRIKAGGTRRALEDLFNQRADVAFLSRPLTVEEESIVHSIGDTALAFPIALGAIAVLAPVRSELDSLSVEQLSRWILELREGKETSDRKVHLYAPDPNLGLWTALTEQLGLSDSVEGEFIWLASDREVALAVGQDRHGLGFASLLALPPGLERLGVRTVPLTGSPNEDAVIPESEELATGLYPLYHYLYAVCRPRGGAIASGFVSFLHSGRCTRLVSRVAADPTVLSRPFGRGRFHRHSR